MSTTTLAHAVAVARRDAHPAGTFDRAGRWYPADSCPACGAIRAPSRAYPYSLMAHARTVAHLAHVHSLDVSTLRGAIRASRAQDAR